MRKIIPSKSPGFSNGCVIDNPVCQSSLTYRSQRPKLFLKSNLYAMKFLKCIKLFRAIQVNGAQKFTSTLSIMFLSDLVVFGWHLIIIYKGNFLYGGLDPVLPKLLVLLVLLTASN